VLALVVEMPNGEAMNTVGGCDNAVRECADDNRPGVHSRGIWKTRRQSARDDITLADSGTAEVSRPGNSVVSLIGACEA
jgi:hypothetical protein